MQPTVLIKKELLDAADIGLFPPSDQIFLKPSYKGFNPKSK